MGDAMSTRQPDNQHLPGGRPPRHLWMHFTRMSTYADHEVPVMVRGEGPWVWDSRGRRYLDGLSGLFVVQAGHGRQRAGRSRRPSRPASWPTSRCGATPTPTPSSCPSGWPSLAPGAINRVFFTTGGGEAVESAWKLARQYFRATGQPGRYKVLSRDIAYHGTTMGALSITGLPSIKEPFEPLVPGSVRVANTNFYRAPEHGDDLEAFGGWAADDIERHILMEGPESVAAVFLEPVQNSGGCFPPPPGYFQRVREICDRHGVLLVSDEVICAFGRLGAWFGCRALRLPARHDHLRQGHDERLLPAGGAAGRRPPHGAVPGRARRPSPTASPSAAIRCPPRWPWPTWISSRRRTWSAGWQPGPRRSGPCSTGLRDLPIVGDVRGDGFFYGIELVKDKATRAQLRRRRVRASAPRLPLGRPVRRRADLPGRRPGRPGDPAGPPAGLRAGALRPHRRDPAFGAERGLVPALIDGDDRFRRHGLAARARAGAR